jgi:hypothetical protein
VPAKRNEEDGPKRLNRVVDVGEALQRSLDPVFRKRGFASRDLVTHWAAMAPTPYDRAAAPDKLVWPRGTRSAEGATLYLRCAPGRALALQHEGPLIARSVNRYFGYVLVNTVRLSAEPFEMATKPPRSMEAASVAPDAELDETVAGVADDGLRSALRRLGRGIKGRHKR